MCRILSPLFFCTIIKLLVCATAFAQSGIHSSTIRQYKSVFERVDADSDRKLSGEELQKFFDARVSLGKEVNAIVAEKFGDKADGIELVDLLQAYVIHTQRAQEAAREEARQVEALQAQLLERMHQEAPQEAAAEEAVEVTEPTVEVEVTEVAEEVTEAVEASEEAEGAPDAVTETESPLAEIFKRLDRNGDGRLAGEEIERLPSGLRKWLDLEKESQPAGYDLADIHRIMVQRLKGNNSRRVSSYFQRYLNRTVTPEEATEAIKTMEEAEGASDAVAETPEDVASEVSESDEMVNSSETTDKAETKALKFEIVLLERATREPPARTLAEEALEVATKGKANNAKLAARIAPLLSAEPNRVTRLVDYFQASTLPGNEVMVQQESRDRRGTNRGTLVRIVPLAGEGASEDVAVTFEKSFFASADILAPEEGEAAEEEGEASEAAMKKAEEAFLAQLSERERQFLSQLRQRGGRPSTESGSQASPDLKTMTAQGSLPLTPGQPAVFSELAGQSENGFHEYVILIELTRP